MLEGVLTGGGTNNFPPRGIRHKRGGSESVPLLVLGEQTPRGVLVEGVGGSWPTGVPSQHGLNWLEKGVFPCYE